MKADARLAPCPTFVMLHESEQELGYLGSEAATSQSATRAVDV